MERNGLLPKVVKILNGLFIAIILYRNVEFVPTMQTLPGQITAARNEKAALQSGIIRMHAEDIQFGMIGFTRLPNFQPPAAHQIQKAPHMFAECLSIEFGMNENFFLKIPYSFASQ